MLTQRELTVSLIEEVQAFINRATDKLNEAIQSGENVQGFSESDVDDEITRLSGVEDRLGDILRELR